MGLEFTIALISDIRVTKTSCVSGRVAGVLSMLSRMRLAILIFLSHTPPICEECGALKIQHTLVLSKYFDKGPSSKLITLTFHFSAAPTKLVPRSDLISRTFPLIETNLLKALMKQELDMFS